MLGNSVEFALLYFACLYLGAVAVPVNQALHKREIEFILQHSRVKLAIYSPKTRYAFDRSTLAAQGIRLLCVLPASEQDKFSREGDGTWSIAATSAALPDGWRPFVRFSPDDLFSITFTSGTTSLPKGVVHRISGLLGNAVTFNKEMGFGPCDRFLHVLPMAYMAGFLNTLLCPFMAGASVVISRPFDALVALNFWQLVMKYRTNTFWLSPSMLAALLHIDRNIASPEYCREHVKTICVGTAPLPLKVKKEFEQKYGVELFESYGLSELLLVTANSARFPRVDHSVGRVLLGIEMRVVNDQGESVAPGEDGEIWIKTPYIMAGYLDYRSLQGETINPYDWFPTGDIGHVSEDGYLFITARKKDLIIRGGMNISPRAVEEILLEHEAVDQVAVIGLPHELYGEEVVAVVKFKEGYTLASVRPSLYTFCKECLNATSVPSHFIEIDRFPMSVTGKVQKNKLREQLSTKFS